MTVFDQASATFQAQQQSGNLRHMTATWREMHRILDNRGIPHWKPEYTSDDGWNACQKLVFHYHGTAVDLNPTEEIFKALQPLAKVGPNRVLAELFLDKPGCGFYKHGVRKLTVPISGHKNHLHVALEIGKHMPLYGDYPQGGIRGGVASA